MRSAIADELASPSNPNYIVLEETVVTARRRTESVESAPVSATVVLGEDLQRNMVQTLQELSRTVPGLTLAQGSTTDRLLIRGIGSGDNPAFEQSVGTFIDDVYHGRARFSEADLFDIERVEILKGPQTTYFGNNTIAGAANVTTKQPESDFGGSVRAAYTGPWDDYLADAVLNVPLSDTLGLRVSGHASGGDGWIRDLNARENVPVTHDAAGRIIARWQPVDGITANVKYQYANDQERGGLPIVRNDCPPPPSFGGATGFCAMALSSPGSSGPGSSFNERNSSSGQRTGLTTRETVSTLSYAAGGITLTSVTAYLQYNYSLATDLDTTPLDLYSVSAPERLHQFSQELRLDSHTGTPIEYLVGAYYQRSGLTVDDDFNYSFLSSRARAIPSFAPLLPYLPLGEGVGFSEHDTALSGFAALTWHVSDRLRATPAIRYSKVDKDFAQQIVFGSSVGAYGPIGPLPPNPALLAQTFGQAAGLGVAGDSVLSRSDHRVSPSFSLEYDLTDGSLAYAKYDDGFKAGGFNGVDTSGNKASLPFGPERVHAFEVGLKSRIFSNHVILNVDAFRSEYADLQLAGVVPSITGNYVNKVQNAGRALSQGLEFEGTWEINPHWRSSFSVTGLDAHYTQYPNATPTAAQTLAGEKLQDLSGRATAFAPHAAAQWATSWSTSLGTHLALTFTNHLYWSAREFLNFADDPYLVQPGYAREDLLVALASSRWELSVIGQNLTDRVIRTYGATIPTSLGSYVFITEPLRNVSAQIQYRF